MIRMFITFAAGLVLAVSVSGCARAKIREVSKKIDAAESALAELKSRENAFEARLQSLENLVSQRQDLATRVVGRWTGGAVQSDGSGGFRETGDLAVTFNSDGSISDVRLPALAGAVGYRVVNSQMILFSFRGGRLQTATNASADGNRLSFQLGGSNPAVIVMTKR